MTRFKPSPRNPESSNHLQEFTFNSRELSSEENVLKHLLSSTQSGRRQNHAESTAGSPGKPQNDFIIYRTSTSFLQSSLLQSLKKSQLLHKFDEKQRTNVNEQISSRNQSTVALTRPRHKHLIATNYNQRAKYVRRLQDKIVKSIGEYKELTTGLQGDMALADQAKWKIK